MSFQSKLFAPNTFKDQVALITGGGSGIGLATARELASLGAKIAIAGRNPDRLEEGRKTLEGDGATVFAKTCDIRDVEQVRQFVAAVKEAYGRVDILINNAGGQFPSPAHLLSPKGFDAVVRNNLNGTFYMTLEVAQQLMIPQQSGAIINVIANIVRGFPGMVHTGAARAGVENMTKTLAVEWARYGIRVNAVAPGTIVSSGTVQYGEELLERSRKATPLQRLGDVEEVSRLLVFLSSALNSFITGSTYYIDGGLSLYGDIWEL
jgi:NAD(P)-dependent dehydrogenase (short-subunit alcohol dehydrogenase family)